MSKQIISTANAPAAIGVYSQAVRVGNTIWVSGQIPLDPATKEMVAGDVEAQVRRVFENLQAIVLAAGASFDDVVKVTVFLTDLSHFGLSTRSWPSTFASPIPRAPPSAWPRCRAAPRSKWSASSPCDRARRDQP